MEKVFLGKVTDTRTPSLVASVFLEYGEGVSEPTVLFDYGRKDRFRAVSVIPEHGSNGDFRLVSMWPTDPDYFVMSAKDRHDIAERIKAVIPYTEGHFELKWFPAGPEPF